MAKFILFLLVASICWGKGKSKVSIIIDNNLRTKFVQYEQFIVVIMIYYYWCLKDFQLGSVFVDMIYV